MNPLRYYRTWQLASALVLTAAAATVGVIGFAPDVREVLAPANDWGVASAAPAFTPAGQPINIPQQMGCKIGRFGEHPWLRPGAPKDAAWRRDSLQAARAFLVPDAVAQELVTRVAADMHDGETVIHNGRIAGGFSGYFSTTYTSSQGVRTVCHASRANLPRGAQPEPAKLYHVGGYWFMVPDRCGNLSRIFPAAPQEGPAAALGTYPRAQSFQAPPAGAVAVPPPPVAVPGPWPLPPGSAIIGTPTVAGVPQSVPEPGAWSLLGLTIGAAALALRRRRK